MVSWNDDRRKKPDAVGIGYTLLVWAGWAIVGGLVSWMVGGAW